VRKLLPHQLLHDPQPDTLPLGPQYDLAPQKFCCTWGAAALDALTFYWINCLGCLKGMLDRSISDPIEEDSARIEITEKCVLTPKRRNRLPVAFGGHKSLLPCACSSCNSSRVVGRCLGIPDPLAIAISRHRHPVVPSAVSFLHHRRDPQSGIRAQRCHNRHSSHPWL